MIERPEVARLLRWVCATWPGSLRAVAGALAGARRAQLAGPGDLEVGATLVVEEIRRARSHGCRSAPRGLRVLPVDPARLAAVEPAPGPAAGPSRIGDALEWMLGFVEVDLRPPRVARLRIEADIENFLGWYVDRLERAAGTGISAIPPSRSLSPKRRLSARLTDPEALRLIAGPPGSRACPGERSWRQGMGYWTIVAILSWAQGRRPPVPDPEALQWWSRRLVALGSRTPRTLGPFGSAPVAPDEAGQALGQALGQVL